MLLEIEKLNQQNKMMNLDLERLSGIESLHAQDLEKFKSEESKRRSEIATLTSRAQNLSAENALLNQQLQQSVDEHGKLSLALVETQGKLSHNDKLNTQKDITLKDQETRLAQLTFDSVQSTNKINQLYNQLETKSHQLEQMESNINEISALYDAEVEKNVKLKTGSIDKFQQLSSTIETLSADLADRQSVVDTLRKEQLNYRQDLKNREQTNQTLETQLEELTDQNQKNSNTVKNLQRKIQNDESSNRKIILELEDKFAFLVESFTQEKESLLKKHNQKQSQFEHLTDQFQRIKTDLQNSSVENAQLQSTVAELKMNEEKLNRQIKNLTQHVNASASEKHANELKVGVLSDHVSRLEAQLGGAGNGVAREQVDMLSRKLKSQVDMLGLKKEFQGIKIPEFY